MKARFGLRGRLLAALLLVLGTLMAVTAVQVVARSERALEEIDQERFLAMTKQLAEATRYGVLARSPDLLAPALDPFLRLPDLARVRVLDEAGRAIAEKDGEARAATEGELRFTAEVRSEASAPGDEAKELAAFGLPASSEPRLIGRVETWFSRAATARAEARMRRDIVSSFLFFGALGLVLVLLLASSVVRRVRLLARAAEKVARGDLSSEVDPRGSDELAALSRDFNAMTAALGEQRRALDSAAASLAEKEALAAIGRATAVIAHELRNPLGILLGASQIAANPTRPDAARIQAAAMMESEVRRLEATLTELLAYARPRAPALSEIELGALIETTAARARYPGGPAEALEIRVVEPIDGAVRADEQQAGQILLNLIINAAQAGARSLSLRVERTDVRVRIHVEDDGPGIDPGIEPQLFRPFVTTKQRGAGLGLAASRRMARDQGGDLIFLASTAPDGRGAHFALELVTAGKEQNTLDNPLGR